MERYYGKTIAQNKRTKIKDALRVGFLINLASYLFGLVVFTGISLSDGVEGYVMLLPAIWWGVGVAGFGLATIIVEVVAHYQEKAEAAGG
ncbi:MAG: hypothetical protein COC03_01360 [Robiginitomaculum sp.]|nr:MAG: hypothetical protein COC03_01360 [Robiginitomaculum sp.]PHQ68450.1 MAG: hypothetical protein COB92_00515 [Robiginitomaculum sp.]